MPWKTLSANEIQKHPLYDNIKVANSFSQWTMGLAFLGLLMSIGELIFLYNLKNIYNINKVSLDLNEYLVIVPNILLFLSTFLIDKYVRAKNKKFLKIYAILAIITPILSYLKYQLVDINQFNNNHESLMAFFSSAIGFIFWTILWCAIFYFSKSFNLNYLYRIRE